MADNNKEKKFKVNNTLYFYDGNELLGKYECVKNTCDYAKTSLDENELLSQKYTIDLKTNLIKNRYAFIEDDGKIILYDVKDNIALKSLLKIKKYVNDEIYVAQDINDKWGVISLVNNYKDNVDFNYNYIEVVNTNSDFKNNGSSYVGKYDNKWSIINDGNKVAIGDIDSQIINYTDLIIVTFSDNIYTVFDYNKVELLKGEFKHFIINIDYIEYVDENNCLNIYDTKLLKNLSEPMKLRSVDFTNVSLFPPYITEYKDNKIIVTIYTDMEYGTSKITEIEI